MSLRKFNAFCKACNRIYSLESSKGEYCSECESSRQAQKGCVPNMTCKICKEQYYSPNHIIRCPSCSVKKYCSPSRKDLVHDNTKIINRKKPRGIPLDELIRRQEYKRVMDDDGWDHYLKGRKWDRI